MSRSPLLTAAALATAHFTAAAPAQYVSNYNTALSTIARLKKKNAGFLSLVEQAAAETGSDLETLLIRPIQVRECWPTAAIPMDNPYCSCKLPPRSTSLCPQQHSLFVFVIGCSTTCLREPPCCRQRIPRYEMLLSELSKNTPAGHKVRASSCNPYGQSLPQL